MVRTQSHLVQPMNLGLILSRQLSNRWIFFLQPFPYGDRILFVRSSHRLLRSQTPGSQITSHRPHRNLQIEFSGQQRLHRFSGPQCKGQAQLVGTTAENVAHRRGCLMRCQSRNRRPSSTPCFQRPTSCAFHQPHPAAHRTSRDPENPSRLGLRKTLLNGLDNSSAKVFLGFSRQRASILFFHARHTNTLRSECHLYYAPISKSRGERFSVTPRAVGAVLKSFGIPTHRNSWGCRVWVTRREEERIHDLVFRFGLDNSFAPPALDPSSPYHLQIVRTYDSCESCRALHRRDFGLCFDGSARIEGRI